MGATYNGTTSIKHSQQHRCWRVVVLQRLATSAHHIHTLIVPCSIPLDIHCCFSLSLLHGRRGYMPESTQPSRASTTRLSLECFPRMLWSGSPRHTGHLSSHLKSPFHSIPSPFHSNPRHVCFGRPTRQCSLGLPAWATHLCSTTSWCTCNTGRYMGGHRGAALHGHGVEGECGEGDDEGCWVQGRRERSRRCRE